MKRYKYKITRIDKTLDALQQWIDDLFKVFHATYSADKPSILTEIMKVIKDENCIKKAVYALADGTIMPTLAPAHSLPLETTLSNHISEKHSDVDSRTFGRGEGDEADGRTAVLNKVVVGGSAD